MIKKIFLLSFLSLIVACVNAQVITNNKVLEKTSREHLIKEVDEYSKAIGLAKEKGWIISQKSKDGRTISLIGVDISGKPTYLTTYNNTIAAATTRANQLWPGGSSGLNLSGSSPSMIGKLATWDGGLILNTHVELFRRVLQKDSLTVKHDDDDHATHTTGTMIASGVNPVAKGMAFGAKQLIAYDYYNDVSEMSSEASGLLLSNHSYGQAAGWNTDGSTWTWYGDLNVSTTEDYGFGYYSSKAQMYDSIAYDAPNYLIDIAAGNSRGYPGPAVGATYSYYDSSFNLKTRARPAGISSNSSYGSIAYGANSKNSLVIGAVNPLLSDYTKASDVVMSTFSSWGPTDDGRIKPDVVADGVGVTSCIATSNTAYASYSGTSMATPNTTGSLYLLQEYYNRLYGSFMRSATLKGLAIHTAEEAGLYPGPDYQYGWGLVNVQKAANVITSSYNHVSDIIIENTLNNGTTYTYNNVIASGKGQLVATLVWTDPPGTVNTVNKLNNTTPKLINDLDMRITKGSNVYKPWILDPANPGNAAIKGDNYLDNVEKVEVGDSTIPGQTYTITVTHKGTLAKGSQAFSLLVSGIGGSAFCASAASSSTAGAALDSVVFAGIANKNTANAGYNDYSNLIASIEPAQINVPITVSVRTRDASSNPRVVRVYIDYNGNGIFESTEQVAQSTIISSSTGKMNATITTPSNLTVGNTILMRVIVLETSTPSDINPCGNYAIGQTEDFRVKVVAPSHDLAVLQIVAPVNNSTFNASQLLSVKLKNVGSADISNITLNATVKNGTTTIATLSGAYPVTISSGNTSVYTFQTPFITAAATTYTINVSAVATGDQNASNDTITQSITILSKPAAFSDTAEICGTTAYLKVNNPISSTNYFWYDTQTATTAIATGSVATTTTIPSNKTYYLASGSKSQLGPVDKTTYGSTGSYVTGLTTPFFQSLTATVPVTIETAKIYASVAGQVKFAVHPGTRAGGYYPSLGDSVIVDVYPNLVGGIDMGNDYYLNLHLDNSVLKSNIMFIYFYNGAAIYANTGITTNYYPVGDTKIITIDSTNFTNPNAYYLFLYNMKVSTGDSLSDRVAVVATTPSASVASAVGNVLTSNIATGSIQWNLNGNSITGANSSTYTATQSGTYTVTITDAYGCSKISNSVTVIINAIQNVNDAEIGLVVSPNPNNGVFHVGFTINTKADVAIELINAAGQVCVSKTYPGFSGQFSQQYNTSNLANGTYILKVQQSGKVYRKRVLIIK